MKNKKNQVVVRRFSLAGPLVRQARRHWQLYLLLLLPLIWLFVFSYVPLFGSQIAFRKYNFRDGVWGSPWVGMENFITFFESKQFFYLIINTLALSLYNIVAGVFPPIILALALTYIRKKRYGKVVQMVTYMPYFISTVLIVGILSQILSLNGPINTFIKGAGGEAINFVGERTMFRHIYVLSGLWQATGYNAVIYLSALASVPQELHEAARVDGAGALHRILYIDLPSLMPTAVILLIMSCGRVLTMGYEKALLLQNPLNMETAEIISTYVYKIGLTSMQYSYSTAIGLFQSVISLLLLLGVNKIAKKLGDTSLI